MRPTRGVEGERDVRDDSPRAMVGSGSCVTVDRGITYEAT